MGSFVSMFRKVVYVFCNLFGLWTLAKGVFSRQNSLMNWNKCENENTTLGFTDYLLRQARFCKMSLNKCKSFHSGETPAPSAPAPRPFQAFQSTLPHILRPKFAFLWMASAGTPPASSPRDVALIILALLCAFFTQNMLSWSLLQHLHCLVFVVFSWFLVPKVQCKALNALGRDSLAAMLRWQSCREMNCTTSGQAQGGKLSELTLSSEPSCAKRKMFSFSIKILLVFFFSWFGWLWVCPHFFQQQQDRAHTAAVISFTPNLQKAVRYLERGWDEAVGALSSPCSVQWRKMLMSSPTANATSPESCSDLRTEDPQGAGGGDMSSSEGSGALQKLKTQLSGPQGSDQV